MKSKIMLCIAAGAAMLTASRTDLNTPVDSQYTKYPNGDVAISAQLTGIYNQFRGPLGRRFMEAMELSSDEMTAVSYKGKLGRRQYLRSPESAHLFLHGQYDRLDDGSRYGLRQSQ